MNRLCHLKDDSVKLVEWRPEYPSIETAERILLAYKKCLPLIPCPIPDQWDSIVKTDLSELQQILWDESPKKLANYLQHYGEKYTGFGGFSLGWDGYCLNREDLASLYKDKLICLAEAVGALPLENPEQGDRRNSFLNVNDVVSLIEEKMKIKMDTPNVMCVLGLPTAKGIFQYRHINALYAAWRISTLPIDLVPVTDAVCEIGGGLGLVALYARKFGITNYTIVDLPIGNVFAANFLIQALGDDAVTLFGEKPPEGYRTTVSILPFWCHTDFETDEFWLTLNQDGFPEMSDTLVKLYINDIAKNTSNYFLSINQEAQSLKVSKLMENDIRFNKIYRSRYWIREGYVEELYERRR